MPLRYSCFISYCHGQGELMRRFIDDLTTTLSDYLEPYLDEKPYIDTKRLEPGFFYNEALAKALCQSACMIVVYVPKYERHTYCLRELEAMERIEVRRKEIKKVSRDRGMIIPIIFRGSPPEKLTARRQMIDFSKYTTASPNIRSNAQYVDEIERIAQSIYAIYQELGNGDPDVCSNCDEFTLPAEQDVTPKPAAEPVYPR